MTRLNKSRVLNAWPEPHPEHGEALDSIDAAALLGITQSGLHARLSRTRAGTLRVPTPEPDGVARRGGPDDQPINFWWRASVERHRDAWRSHARRALTPDDVELIRRLRAEGDSMHGISRRTGFGTATISRIVNGQTHTPKDGS